jgi:hypothetical protein
MVLESVTGLLFELFSFGVLYLSYYIGLRLISRKMLYRPLLLAGIHWLWMALAAAASAFPLGFIVSSGMTLMLPVVMFVMVKEICDLKYIKSATVLLTVFLIKILFEIITGLI